MSIASVFFPVATIALAVACFACYKTSKPLRDKAREDAQAELDKAAAEVKRLAQEARDAEVAEAVTKALRVLFDEARDYSHRYEEGRRSNRSLYRSERSPVFNRETREVFHKVLRVGALEVRVDNIEEGNKVRREDARKVRGQLEDIQRSIAPYA